jgi:hypothetical protein
MTRALTDRFTEQLPTQNYYNKLYDTRQEQGEIPAQFLDRCRTPCDKTVRMSHDPVEQRVLAGEGRHRLATAFINWMQWAAGTVEVQHAKLRRKDIRL